jgi:hypothetical protein
MKSPERKRFMVQLIIACELHDLTEKESLSSRLNQYAITIMK